MERIRMDRVNAILKHKTYRKYYDQIEKIEKDRIFCRHQMPHLLDVARIAYITNLERNLGYDRAQSPSLWQSSYLSDESYPDLH